MRHGLRLGDFGELRTRGPRGRGGRSGPGAAEAEAEGGVQMGGGRNDGFNLHPGHSGSTPTGTSPRTAGFRTSYFIPGLDNCAQGNPTHSTSSLGSAVSAFQTSASEPRPPPTPRHRLNLNGQYRSPTRGYDVSGAGNLKRRFLHPLRVFIQRDHHPGGEVPEQRTSAKHGGGERPESGGRASPGGRAAGGGRACPCGGGGGECSRIPGSGGTSPHHGPSAPGEEPSPGM